MYESYHKTIIIFVQMETLQISKDLFASHTSTYPTWSNTLQSIVLHYVYYRMEHVGTNRSTLGQCNANKPKITFIFLNVLRTQMSKHIYYTRASLRDRNERSMLTSKSFENIPYLHHVSQQNKGQT